MLKSAALSASLIAGANAFWRMECPGRVGVARIDPVVNPNDISPHSHSIHGSSAFSERSGSAELMNGNCTSCRVTQDKSAYWHPAIYFEDASTGQVELVPQVGGMLAYYLLYGDNITTFPKGFRMISGSSERRTYTVGDPNQPDPPKSQWAALGQTTQDKLAQRAVGFNCLNYAKAPEGTLYRHCLPDKSFLDQNCQDGLRFELMFPSCWNGRDIDSQNHKDHVAFPDLVMTGPCPASHSVRLPSLLFEVIWNTAAFKNRNGRFVLSNGDITGFGYHGDFITGWEPDFLQKAINTCTNPSGRIEDCPLFNVVDQGQATSCKMQEQSLPQALVGENVLGPMAKLPGGVIIGNNGDDDDQGKAKPPTSSSSTPSTSSTSAANLTYRPGEKATNPATPLPGQAFKEQSSSASPTTNPGTSSAIAQALKLESTTTSAPPTPPGSQPSYFSTRYLTNGNVVIKVLLEETWVTVTESCDTPATTTPAVVGQKHRRHAAHHAHGRGKLH